MKEQIYTIPVNDAYMSDAACPLCAMQAKLDADMIEYYLGAALMEPDVRKTTNDKGFCRQHLSELYCSEENRLGLGLTLHTHLQDLIDDLLPGIHSCGPAAKKNILSGRDKNFKKKIADMAEKVRQREQSCVICDRLTYTMDRYLDVIFYQYFEDPAFRERFSAGRGYCLPHLATLLEGAAKYLNQNQAAVFISHLAKLETGCLETLRDDVEWYTLKFDYRNHDKSWKNSKDALPRAIRRLAGETDLNCK